MGIICLLIINSTISFIEENNAGNAAAALMAHLAPKTRVLTLDLSDYKAVNMQKHINFFILFKRNDLMQVLRDGQWQEQDASILVPGDIISIKLGDIIPADARLLEGDPLKIDQASSQKLEETYLII